MSIPDYQTIMLPLLGFLKEDQEVHIKNCASYICQHFNLTEQEKRELLPSGKQSIIVNRTAWARTYLKKAGLLSSPKRGFVKITDKGKELLLTKPKRIDNSVLKRYQSFIDFQSPKEKTSRDKKQTQEDASPEEALEQNYEIIRKQLADELLQEVMNSSPEFFEILVVELIVAMGYGGSIRDAGRATRKSGDGGIDGIIKEDKLGLDTIYIQAKRWENSVQRPEIQKFAGALQGERAKKGIFITTSNFSKGAIEYINNIDIKIVLIGGQELTDYMIDYGIGVSSYRKFEVKRIDTDYFKETEL